MQYKIFLTKEDFDKCKMFAEVSAKTQREYRSGGEQVRPLFLIQSDTLRGKVGEVATIRFLEQPLLSVKRLELDFNIYPRGKWDQQDFTINGKIISIKSAKWFSKWLLLESKDIERGDIYDYYIFITVSEDFKSATILGYATKDEIISNVNTLKLKQGEVIPSTHTFLDADNYARHSKYLHNLESDWKFLIE